MEFIEGKCNSNDYFQNQVTKSQTVINAFLGLLQVLEYVHSKQTLHMDIKPGNILISKFGNPILTDFGCAKKIGNESKNTIISGTEGYMHPDAYKHIPKKKNRTDINRIKGKIPRRELRFEFDLYSLGKTFLEFLSDLEKNKPDLLTPYQIRFLGLFPAVF